MKTKTEYHELTGDTVFLAQNLKRLERKARQNLLTDWLCQQLRKELEWRAQRAAWRLAGARNYI